MYIKVTQNHAESSYRMTLAEHTCIKLQAPAGHKTRLITRNYVGHVHLQMSNVDERPCGDMGELIIAT